MDWDCILNFWRGLLSQATELGFEEKRSHLNGEIIKQAGDRQQEKLIALWPVLSD
jgi:hypothetical protein